MSFFENPVMNGYLSILTDVIYRCFTVYHFNQKAQGCMINTGKTPQSDFLCDAAFVILYELLLAGKKTSMLK
jgi:hypothetical protein